MTHDLTLQAVEKHNMDFLVEETEKYINQQSDLQPLRQYGKELEFKKDDLCRHCRSDSMDHFRSCSFYSLHFPERLPSILLQHTKATFQQNLMQNVDNRDSFLQETWQLQSNILSTTTLSWYYWRRKKQDRYRVEGWLNYKHISRIQCIATRKNYFWPIENLFALAISAPAVSASCERKDKM